VRVAAFLLCESQPDSERGASGCFGVVFLPVLSLCVLCDRPPRGFEMPIFEYKLICSITASESTTHDAARRQGFARLVRRHDSLEDCPLTLILSPGGERNPHFPGCERVSGFDLTCYRFMICSHPMNM
jgi:hypothetical protein